MIDKFKGVQFASIAGFLIVIGIVASQFAFNPKIVVACLAGLAILVCASFVDGLVRFAMLGIGVLLGLFVVADLAFECNDKCQADKAIQITVAPVRVGADCDGTYRDYHLADRATPIPCQGHKVGWNVLDGALVLIDRDGKEYGPYRKGDDVGPTPPALEWRSGGGNALIKVRFY